MVNIREKLQKHPLIGTLVLLLLYIAILIVPDIILSPFYGLIAHLPYVILLFIGLTIQIAFHVLLWNIVVPFGLHLPNGKESYSEYNKSIRLSNLQPLRQNVLLGLGGALIYFTCILVGAILLGTRAFDPSTLVRTPVPENRGWWYFFFGIIPGIWEEISFRGVILTLLLKKYSEKNSIILNGFIFGLLHSVNAIFLLLGGVDVITVLLMVGMQMIYAVFIGAFFTYIVIKTDSLLPSIMIHYLIDSVISGVFSTVTSSDPTAIIIFSVLFIGIIPSVINIVLLKFIMKRVENSVE